MPELRKLTLAVVVTTMTFFGATTAAATYDDLVSLFEEWRAFEQPPLLDGAPDYTAETTARRHAELRKFQDRLYAMDVSKMVGSEQWKMVGSE